jgi:hypothetical protein
MRFCKRPAFLLLTLGLVFAPSAWAPQKIVAPTLRSAPTGHLPGTRIVAASLPRHTDVAASSPRHTDVAASSPRHGGLKPPLQSADLKVSDTTAAGTSPGDDGSPAKPFTQEQVVSMVRDGFGDESGAKLIEQRGIDFAPSEDFIQTLKAAGASEAFLKALRAAVAPGLSPTHAALKGGSTTASPNPRAPRSR